MEPKMTASLKLVPCTEEYWEFVRLVRTDPRTIGGFIQQSPISPDQQKSFMSKHWNEYFVALKDGQPVGFCGVIDDDIRVATHSDHQKTGAGKFMIMELMKKFPTAVAKIKADNEASRKLFESAGFVNTFVVYENVRTA